jgi:hypothetical protein
VRDPDQRASCGGAVGVVGAVLVCGWGSVAQAVTVVGGQDGTDDKVSDHAYVRHDGGTDPAIQECSSDATDPTAVPATAADLDPNDGGGEKQQNEPAVAVDPTDPTHVVASWNEYCTSDLGYGFLGLGFSTDSGETWVSSLTPGYPTDSSSEGQNSPLFGTRTQGSDPLLAFNSDGDLYSAGIAYNNAKPQHSAVYVSRWAGQPAGPLPYDYQRTALVGRAGTPSLAGGLFTDKPMMEVDRTDSQYNGNVYVCWSRFVGAAGRTKIFFSRSTDDGLTFSPQIALSEGRDVQGCDIAVEADGDVYVVWGTRDTPSATDREGVAVARSANGGRTFSDEQQVGSFRRYFPFDTARDCGDGLDLCPSEFVFARIPLEPRVTSDQSGELPGVYVTYNAIDPATITDSVTSYDSAGAGSGLVGRGVVYVTRSTNNGRAWDDPVKVDDAGGSGHQFFPDVDALDGTLVAIWQDNRGADYSVQRPIGNTAAATSSGATVGTFAAYSTNGATFTPLGMVSSVRQQIQYEMFDARSVPFIGDYNWVSLVSTAQGLSGYMAWTDNRDVVPGTDPREEVQDGFDVHMCVTVTDGVASPNTCANAGGFDQNIYGTAIDILP